MHVSLSGPRNAMRAIPSDDLVDLPGREKEEEAEAARPLFLCGGRGKGRDCGVG